VLHATKHSGIDLFCKGYVCQVLLTTSIIVYKRLGLKVFVLKVSCRIKAKTMEDIMRVCGLDVGLKGGLVVLEDDGGRTKQFKARSVTSIG